MFFDFMRNFDIIITKPSKRVFSEWKDRQKYGHWKEGIYVSRRGENIYKRKDGRYEGRYIKMYDCEGKAKYGAVYAKTYAETKEKLYLAKETLILNQNYRKSAQSVSQWFLDYLEKIKNTDVYKRQIWGMWIIS